MRPHVCWVGVRHDWNPDGRCFVCEEIDKLTDAAPQNDEKSQIPDREGTK